MAKNKRAQIWVETVIYTLIGLAIIGILLAITLPKINSEKDRLLIEQTIDSLNKVDAKIYEVQSAPGNKRILDLKVSKGNFVIDSENDKIIWTVESKHKYSEPGEVVSLGRLNVLTTEASPWEVELSTEKYPVDLVYDGEDELKELGASATSYKLSILNLGVPEGGDRVRIDLGVV